MAQRMLQQRWFRPGRADGWLLGGRTAAILLLPQCV